MKNYVPCAPKPLNEIHSVMFMLNTYQAMVIIIAAVSSSDFDGISKIKPYQFEPIQTV